MLLSCCLFKKCTSRRPSQEIQRPPVQVSRANVELTSSVFPCGKCKVDQQVPPNAIAMVCSNCYCVNRLITNGSTRERRGSFIDCDLGDSQLIENNATTFQLGDGADGKSVPLCSVCLDGPGDMILENCGHGGICDDCSRHIALNRAVGGAHCPLDKQEIVGILRIGEINPQFVKARKVTLPEAAASQPPRVPPPVGLRKEKGHDGTRTPTDKLD